MRILHILPSRERRYVENYAAKVILGLQKTDIEQCVVINRRSPHAAAFEKAGVKILPRPFYVTGLPLGRLWLARWIARMQPDLAHCWTRNAARLVPYSKMPVVGWFAGYDGSRHLTRCSHIISARRQSVPRFAKKCGFSKQARFIPAFPEFKESPPLDRHRLATPRNAKVLLSFASLQSMSQIGFLLTILKDLPDCVLWLGGEGSSRHTVEKSAIAIGVIDRVRFTTPGMNSYALLRAADLCVITADDRSLDRIVPKAWAAGAPIVASRKTGFDSPLENGVTGLLVPFGDKAALMRAIRQVLDENNLRGRLVAKGYAAWLGTYACEAVVRQWMEFYEGVRIQGPGFRD